MRIETTVHLTEDAARRLDGVAERLGVSRSSVMVSLMNRVMVEHRSLVSCWCRVKYQRKGVAGIWRRCHVTLEARDYEFFLDSRKLFKRSVSLLLAWAVDNFLDELLEPDESGNIVAVTDNYRFHSYLLMQETVPGAICWRIYWNIPLDPDKIFPK
jgi:hypothetical protein